MTLKIATFNVGDMVIMDMAHPSDPTGNKRVQRHGVVSDVSGKTVEVTWIKHGDTEVPEFEKQTRFLVQTLRKMILNKSYNFKHFPNKEKNR